MWHENQYDESKLLCTHPEYDFFAKRHITWHCQVVKFKDIRNASKPRQEVLHLQERWKCITMQDRILLYTTFFYGQGFSVSDLMELGVLLNVETLKSHTNKNNRSGWLSAMMRHWCQYGFLNKTFPRHLSFFFYYQGKCIQAKRSISGGEHTISTSKNI